MMAAADLKPELTARSEEAERLGRMPDATIESLDEAGITRMTVPAAYGGGDVSVRDCQQILEELARGCGSTSFVVGVYAAVCWMIRLMPDLAQEDTFASENPKTICTLSPGGSAAQVGDGYVLSGRWGFCTGHYHAGWALMLAELPAKANQNGGAPELGYFLVPRSEFKSENDWRVTGLAGTGSDTLSVEETFVPSHRALLMYDLFEKGPGTIACSYAAQAPTALGIARAALEIFVERIGRRGITYTPYARQADATVTHLQMAEATMKLDEARFHSDRLAETAALAVATSELDVATRVRCRADLAWTARLCQEAVAIVQSASGASSIHRRDPLQRIVRDMQAYSLHSSWLFSTYAELYGRILCGLDTGEFPV